MELILNVNVSLLTYIEMLMFLRYFKIYLNESLSFDSHGMAPVESWSSGLYFSGGK